MIFFSMCLNQILLHELQTTREKRGNIWTRNGTSTEKVGLNFEDCSNLIYLTDWLSYLTWLNFNSYSGSDISFLQGDNWRLHFNRIRIFPTIDDSVSQYNCVWYARWKSMQVRLLPFTFHFKMQRLGASHSKSYLFLFILFT